MATWSQVLEDDAVYLEQQYISGTAALSQMQEEVLWHQAMLADAAGLTRGAEARAAALERRLLRARDGGKEVAGAAEQMHDQLLDARESTATNSFGMGEQCWF